MLDSFYIGKSKIRQSLLAIFFTNPTQKYYLRELQRILGYSAGSIRRELMRFQGDGLFVTKRTGNLLYYSLNQAHPLFKDLKSIISKTVGIEAGIKSVLSGIKGIKAAFIYGSFASGKENSASDIDIMIIGSFDSSVLNERLCVLEKRLRREINPTSYSYREYKAKKRLKSGFILELLKRPKIILVGKKDDL